MKLIFAGTKTEFALPTLQRLIEWSQTFGHELVAVYTQPDRPQGRGKKLLVNKIKQTADAHHISVYQPINLKDSNVQATMRALNPDVLVVVAYGLLLPVAVLNIPKQACLNVHASLLPRWLGAAPIQNALLAGDFETGVTIMQMDAGLDTGPLLHQVYEPILATDTTNSLQARLAWIGAEALINVVNNLETFLSEAQQQEHSQCTYAPKILKEEGAINWSLPADILCRRIRAFNPWPVMFTYLNQRRIRIWSAQPYEIVMHKDFMPPGTIVALLKEGIVVATGSGDLQITHLQLEGGICLPFDQLWQGALSWMHKDMQFKSID